MEFVGTMGGNLKDIETESESEEEVVEATTATSTQCVLYDLYLALV